MSEKTLRSIRKQMYEFTGLQFAEDGDAFYGNADEFLCQLYGSGMTTLLVFSARPYADEADDARTTELRGQQLQADAAAACGGIAGVNGCRYVGNALIVQLAATTKELPALIARLLPEMARVLRQYKAQNVCMGCGADHGVRHAVVDGKINFLCPDCTEQRIAKLNTEIPQHSSPLVALIAGLAAALCAFLFIFLPWQINLIVYGSGAVGAAIGLGVAHKLEKHVSALSLASCMIFGLISICFTSVFCVADTMAGAFEEAMNTGSYTAEYEADCEDLLEKYRTFDQLTDTELMDALDLTDVSETRDTLRLNIRELEQELENITFARAHTSTLACMEDLGELTEWTDEEAGRGIYESIIKNLLPSALALLIVGISSLVRTIRLHRNGVSSRSL